MTPDMFRKLAALGLSHDQMAGVLEIFEVEAETRKEKARSRVQKWRDKKRDETQRNVTEHNETQQTGSRAGDARGEDNLQDKILSGEDKKTNTTAPKARANDLAAFKSELADLDPERLEAIIKHRRSKRGQLTAHAARLFRSDAAACGLSIAEAVDTCISRNWITVKPEYLAGRNTTPRQSTSPPRKPNAFDAYVNICRQKGWNPDATDDLPSNHDDAQCLPSEWIEPGGTVVDLRPGAFRRVRSGDL